MVQENIFPHINHYHYDYYDYYYEEWPQQRNIYNLMACFTFLSLLLCLQVYTGQIYDDDDDDECTRNMIVKIFGKGKFFPLKKISQLA